jgi:dynein intermediate chain 2, axonemal
MYHFEGGWPSDFDDIQDDKKRKTYIKKNIERNKESTHDRFLPSLVKLCNNVTEIIRTNNQIDMFEEYFDQGEPEHNIEKLSVKTLMLFKDPKENCKRSVSKISWHPDGPTSLAAAYSIMRF